MGDVNEHAVFRLGVMVERIASEAGLQGTAYAWDSGPTCEAQAASYVCDVAVTSPGWAWVALIMWLISSTEGPC